MKENSILKKIIAFLCVISITISSLTVMPSVYAGNSDPFEGYTPVTLSDFGITEKTYTFERWDYNITKALAENTLNKKKVNLNATFYDAASLLTFGELDSSYTTTPYPIRTAVDVTNNTLTFFSPSSNTGTIVFSATDMNITNIVGAKLKIEIGFEVVNSDVKVVTSVNDCTPKTGTYTGFANSFGSRVGIYVAGNTSKVDVESVVESTTPSFDGYTPVTLSDFSIAAKTYTFERWDYNVAKSLADNTLNKKKVSLNATFYDAATLLAFGEQDSSYTTTPYPIRTAVDVTNNTLTFFSPSSSTGTIVFSAADMKITNIVGAKLKIEIGFEVVNSDVKVVASVNGCTPKASTYTGFASSFGSKVGVYVAGATSKVDLENVVSGDTTPEPSPDTLSPITWNDFGIEEDTTYTFQNNAIAGQLSSTTYKGTSLVGTSFRGEVVFNKENETSGNYMISYGDSGYNSYGLRIKPQSDGTIVIQGIDIVTGVHPEIAVLNPEKVELDSFTDGTRFTLGIDIWAVGDDLKINLFANNVQYTVKPYVWKNAAKNNLLSTNMNFWIAKDQDSITADVDEAEATPEGLTALTWKDFGLEETTTYTSLDVPASYASYGLVPLSLNAEHKLTSLVGTSFRGKIALKKGSDQSKFYICYGDEALNSHGIRLVPQSDGSLLFQAMDIAKGYPYPEVANVLPTDVNMTSFTDGTPFEIGIDIWAEGANIKINVFVNGVQCTWDACVLEGAVTTNTGSTKFLGANVNIFSVKDNDEITLEVPLGEDEQGDPEESPKDLIDITWADFGLMEEVKYTAEDVPEEYQASGVIPKRWNSDKSLTSLIGTSFRGKLSLKQGSADSAFFVSYGDSGLNTLGLRFIPQKNGKLLVQAMDMQVGWPYLTIATLNPKRVGLTSFSDGTAFELGIDMWEVEDVEDGIKDVKINLFINGTQYNMQSYVWENAMANDKASATKFLGNNINLCLVRGEDEIVIYGEKPNYGTPIKPDASLKEISFSSFGVEDGIYDFNKKDLSVKGGYYDPIRGKSLNGTLFNGYVTFAKKWGIQLRIGGKNTGWEGIILVSNGDGKLLLVDDKNNTWCVYTPELAGTQLTEKQINLKMSIQYVDSDKDGKKDDVKLGVWFNDVLYKNSFIYMTDYAAGLGSMFGIYSPEKGVNMKVKSADVDNSIDFSIFGFDKNYASYLKKTAKPMETYLRLPKNK